MIDKPGPKPKGIAERFWPKVSKTDSCWLWTAHRNQKGYGTIQADDSSRPLLAHRVSRELHFGPIPDGLCVLHRCDVANCVRPDHLFLGTVEDNNLDMLQKGRASGGKLHGEDANGAKLTTEAVLEMRSDFGNMHRPPLKTIGRKYGIAACTVWLILTRRTWKHV